MSFVAVRQIVVLATLSFAAAAFSQGTRADYERAKNLRRLTTNKVYRDQVKPNWLPGGSQLWYRVKTGAETHEFIFVDAKKGVRRPAFDHAKLAEALASAGVKNAHADRLPIEITEFDPAGNAVELRIGNKGWRCDLRTYKLEKSTPGKSPSAALHPGDAPRASRRRGAATWITFDNQTKNEVQLFWLDDGGQRQSYGKIAAGKKRNQHTFGEHVWLVADAKGKALAVFVAQDEETTAVIDGEAPPRRSRDSAQPSRRSRSGGSSTSPDGKWRAFIKDCNVFLRDQKSAAEFTLSKDGAEDDAYSDRFYWSPDSTRLVAMRSTKGFERTVNIIESSPKDQVQPKLHSYSYRKPGDAIPQAKPHLFDIAARKEIATSDTLFPNPWRIDELRWAPDSSRFTFLYNQRGHQILRVVAVDAKTGAARAIIDEQSPTFIDYAYKKYLRFFNETNELLWMSERDGWNHLYLYDAQTGRVKNQITKGQWLVRGIDRIDEQARQIWFHAGGVRPGQDPYYIHYCRIDFDGKGLTILTAGDGTHKIEYSPDGRFFIDAWSRVDLPPVTELRRAKDGELIRELERGDWSELLKTGWRPPQRFAAKGRDGQTDIYGVLFLPTNFDPKKKYPIVEQIYAGPQSSYAPTSFRSLHGVQEMAELGFITVMIDGMGANHRSKKFHDVCWKNLGDSGFPDRILWMQAAANNNPALDLTRVGVYGGSAGGQNALSALLRFGDFYKAAAADCGCHDNRMDKIW